MIFERFRTPKEYPDAISRIDSVNESEQEGGYRFLKRALAKNLLEGKPVVINLQKTLYLQYQYLPGHTNFWQGVKLLQGKAPHLFKAFRETAETYDVERGIEELKKDALSE